MKRLFLVCVSLITLLAGVAPAALAETVPMVFPRLAQVGPIDGDNGYPIYYEDSQGVRLQLCIDPNDPLCAMVLDEIPDPTQPISLQAGNFPGEAFYQLAEADFSIPGGGNALGTFALEAAFANGDAIIGEQITFGRVRLRIDGLQRNQTYTISHPYGTEILETDVDGVIEFTEDIGIDEGFPNGATQSRIGTFLQWDTGAPVAPAGYIGDPNVGHKIIGGIFNGTENQNYFRIEGPGITSSCGLLSNCAQTEFFSLMGKLAVDVIAAPAVNPVTNQDTVITGSAEVGALIEIKSGTIILGSALTAADGSFSVPIDTAQAGGTVLSVTAQNLTTNNISKIVRVTVKDIIAPSVPVVNDVSDKDIAVTGVAETGSTVEVKSGDTSLGTATAVDGSFSVPISVQSAGTILSITAKDTSGNISPAVQLTVIDKTPPAIPVVNEINDLSTEVTGTVEAGATVEIKSGETVLGADLDTTDGSFNVPISVQSAGTILSISAKDAAGNVSNAVQVTVIDKTPPIAPVVNRVTDAMSFVRGKAEPGSTVFVKVGTTVIGSAPTNSLGNFAVAITKRIAGTVLTVISVDGAKNNSTATTVTVIDVTPPKAPLVNKVTDAMSFVRGKAEPGSTVFVKVGATLIGSAKTNSLGNFAVTITKQKAGTKLTVLAKDSAGNNSSATTVTVIDVTPPKAPLVNIVTDAMSFVRGKAEPGSTVFVKVGTTVIGSAKTNSLGNFAVTITKQKAGTKLTVIAVDGAKNNSAATTVTVVDI